MALIASSGFVVDVDEMIFVQRSTGGEDRYRCEVPSEPFRLTLESWGNKIISIDVPVVERFQGLPRELKGCW